MGIIAENFDTIEGDIEVGVERLVGTFKINGTVYNRYVKVIDFGAMPSNTIKSVAHNVSGLSSGAQILSLRGRITSADAYAYPLPYYDPNSNSNGAGLFAGISSVTIRTIADWTGYTAYVTMEYYK